MPKRTQMIWSKTWIVRIGLEISLVSVLRVACCVWRCLQRWNSVCPWAKPWFVTQTTVTWQDKRLNDSISPPVDICKTTSGRDMLDKQNSCYWDSTGRREPFKRVLEIIKLAQRVCIDRGEKFFRHPFRLGSRVGNSCFSSRYIENSWNQIVV